MTNCIDITNLTSEQLDTLLKDLLSGKKTFAEAVAENPSSFSVVFKDEEKDEKDVKEMSTIDILDWSFVFLDYYCRTFHV